MDLGSPADVSGNGLAVTYFDDGAENRRTLPNGAYTDHTWDDLRLPASVKNYDGTSSRTLKSQFDTFTYDGVFNMTGLTTSNNAVAAFNGTNTWAYDSKDRLTGDALTGGAAYSLTNAYDSAGNPTTYRNVASQTFNADNQKTASGTFVYDGNGNPTTYAGGTLTFDPM
ncbi:MAG: hypothetical protein JNM34_12910, partial [Chthonomonadaceae bacterium]|nr:hypothetical protein [Chthonomonadaceae bacterium]